MQNWNYEVRLRNRMYKYAQYKYICDKESINGLVLIKAPHVFSPTNPPKKKAYMGLCKTMAPKI